MTINAHFVGSVGLDTVAEVFSTIGGSMQGHIKRCPDGEVGGRRMWIGWQWPVLRANPSLEVVGNQAMGKSGLCPICIKPGVADAEIHFGELGYSREARASYQDFLVARDAGQLPQSARFQVCLPTPWAVISGGFIVLGDVRRVFAAYKTAMIAEIGRICAAIPHQDLAIQMDVCIELIQWDGNFVFLPSFPDMAEVFTDQFAALGAAVPAGVELGVHLCYGDMDGVHFIEPDDLGSTVSLGNLIIDAVGRPLHWVHVPVPIQHDDEAYFAPLKTLKRGPGTELFLGLVHVKDGAEGTVARINAAKAIVSDFGIATECGIARARTPELVRQILQVHADAIATIDG